MPHVVLTQTLLDGALAPGDYVDLALANFALRVGKHYRAFYVRLRQDGKRFRVALAEPGDPKLGPKLVVARKRAARVLQLHADGKLRPAAGVDAAGLNPDTATVAELAQAYLDEHAASWSANWLRNCRGFAKRLTRAHGTVLARSLSRHQLKTLVRKYAERAPVNANRYHAFLSKLCRWAVTEELLDRNPIDQLRRVTIEESRDRELAPAEIVQLWRALDAVAADPKATPRERVTADVTKLRLLTAQRDTPLRSLRWEWVNFDDNVLDLPASVMKGRKGRRLPHVVPLGARALAMLTARRAAATLADQLVFGMYPGTTKTPTRTRERFRATLGLRNYQDKDLRRTAATLMAKHGVTEFVVARCLAHKNTTVTGKVYNRYDYLAEKRVAFDVLDRVVTGILEPAAATSAPVLPFHRA